MRWGNAVASGARICAEALHAAGIRTVFGVPGQRILPVVDELENRLGVQVVLTRHEQGAAFMADAYGRVAGLGCCFATSGPGATNLLTGVAAAFMDSVPLLAITAQAETTEFGRYGIQEGTGFGRTPDVSRMFAATCKASLRPMSPAELAPALDEAVATAQSGRHGPVHVDIPSDLFLADADASAGKAAARQAGEERQGADDEAVRAVVELIAAAERPLFLAGNGVIRSTSVDALMRLAEGANIAVAGTFLAKAILDERHPLVLGPVGVYGRPEANAAMHREADLVVALGVSFNYMTTTGWASRFEGSRLVRIDLDARELSNNYTAGLQIKADVGVFLEQLAAAGLSRRDASGWIRRLREAAAADPIDEPTSGASGVHPVEVCRALGDHLDERTTVVVDVGQNAYWVERHLRTFGGGRFLINGGLGSMGHGVAGAIGVAKALDDRGDDGGRVLAICGDGGFMMGGLELSVAAELGLAVTWVIFNNTSLGTQRAWFEREGRPPAACELPPVDFVELSRSLGVEGERVSDVGALHDGLARSAADERPYVIEVAIDPAPAPTPYQP